MAGASTMVVELAAVRLLAPWFGTSLVVWTNVIAVILLALSAGYLLGGRLASAREPARVLSRMLGLAGVLVAFLPYLGGAAAHALMPESMALHQAAGLVTWGSLAVALLAFLPPATLLGTVCPLVVEWLARNRTLSAGRAGGLVLFTSTAGSLAGVFGTSHFLLPTLGLRYTFLLAGCTLLGAAMLARAVVAATVPLRGTALPAVFLLAALLAPDSRPALLPGRAEIARRESAYQSLRVVEDRTSAEPIRWLQVNEGLDSFQSVWQPEVGLLPEGYYYNDFLLPLSWAEPHETWRVLVLGLGAGTAARVFGGAGVDARVTGVELDPAVIELGREWFGLEESGSQLEVVSGCDARVALRSIAGAFDEIVLDCYANQIEIPPHLCTREFFEELRRCLVEGGWLAVNLGGFAFEDPVVDAVARTCALAFEARVLLVRVPKSRNYMLLARRGAELPWQEGALRPADRESALALGPRLLPGFSCVVEPGGPALLDDRCPMEALQLRSLSEASDRRASEHP